MAANRHLAGLFAYSRRALTLVWSTNKGLSLALGGLTLVAGALPAAIAFVGALIVDAVIHAAAAHRLAGAAPRAEVLGLVGLAALRVAITSMAQRGL